MPVAVSTGTANGSLAGAGQQAGLDLDGAVAAGGAAEFPDRSAGGFLDPPADRQRREDDGQTGDDQR